MKQITGWTCLCLSISAMITFLSCHKSGDTNNSKTKAALLISGIWKYAASTITLAYDYYGDGITSTNLFAIMKACEKDDFETYKANGIWEYNEGPTLRACRQMVFLPSITLK